MDDLEIVENASIDNIRVEGCFQPILLFDGNWEVSNKYSGENYYVPKSIQVSWYQARHLRKILLARFTVRLVLKTQSQLQEFQFSNVRVEPRFSTGTHVSTRDIEMQHIPTISIYPPLS
jgi:hypothetical protein